MEILKLALRFPYPALGGSQLRDYNLLRHLGKRHAVSLFCFVDRYPSPAECEHMREFCADIFVTVGGQKSLRTGLRNMFEPVPYHVTSFRSRAMRQEVAHHLANEQVDVIDASLIQMTQYFPPVTSAVKVLDQQNADRMVWGRLAASHPSPVMRSIAFMNLLKMKAYERRVYPLLDMAVSVSEEDRAITRTFAPENLHLHLAPNGVDADFFAPQPEVPENPDALLICGGLGQDATVDAVLFFVAEMWPTIRQQRPTTQLWLVGRNPVRAIQALDGQAGITVSASVPDVRPYYAGAALVLAPYRLGGGTKLKVLNAMAMGKAVLATPVGAQGLDLAAGAVCIAETPQDYIAQVLHLLDDSAARQQMGRLARQEMIARYDWATIAQDYEQALQTLVGRKQQAGHALAA